MTIPSPRFSIRIFAVGLAIAALAGCSAESKKAGHLAKGGQFLAAGNYEKAELEYKNALQIDRLNPEAISRLGIIYFDQGRLGPSLIFLRKANELQPQNADVRLRLVKALVGIRQFDEARIVAALLLEQNPPNEEIPALLAEAAVSPKEIADTRARLLQLPNQSAGVLTGLAVLELREPVLELRERKLKEAEALLTRSLELDPKLSSTNAVLGMIYLAQKDLPKAEQAFSAAAASAPARSPRRTQLAQFYLQTGQLPAAKRVLDETLKGAPDFIPTRILMADIAAREQRLDESLAQLDRIFALDPTHPEAILLAARVRLAKGDTDKAVTILETAIKVYPKSELMHHHLGLAYLAKFDTAKATASFVEAININPDFAASIIALAELNVRQRNFSPAIATLRQLLQKGEIPEARFLLGNAYRLQGNLDDALATYRQLSTALPNNAQLHLFTGVVLLQQNKRPEGREELAKAAELAPGDLTALGMLVNLDLAEKQYVAARKRVDDQMTKTPTAAGLQILLSSVLLAQSDTAGAESALRKAIELQPEAIDAYIILAQLYISRNEHTKALTDLQAAATKNPKDPRPFMLSAVLHEQQKNYPAARENYEKTLAINPRNGVALNNLASLYSEQSGDQDKALDLAQKAKDLLPNQAEVGDTLGWILYKKRNYPRALALLEEASAKLTENAEVQYHLGVVCYRVGDEGRAKNVLDGALKLSGKFNGADDARKVLAVLNVDPTKGGAAARAELEKAVAAQPDDSIALNRLGMLHEREGSGDKALASYAAAAKASPGNLGAALNAIRLYRARNDTANALELAKALRTLSPADARVAHVYGQLAYQTADYPRAYSLLQDAARRQPDDSAILYDLASAAYSVGRVADAQNSMREAMEKTPGFTHAAAATKFLELTAVSTDPAPNLPGASKIEESLKADPANVPALMAKAALAEARRDVETARQCYEKALGRFPDFFPAKRQLAIIFAEKPVDDKKALELATKAREALPNDADLARALGIITYRTGNYSRAASLLQESARTRTNDAELMYFLGMAQHQLKDQASSTRALQRSLELGLKGDHAKEAQRVLTPEKSAK